MEQTPLFFEDAYEALRHVVQSAGGAKVVGSQIFAEKPPEQAGRYLMDCLNPARSEKLDIEQVLLILRIGQKVGCHSAIEYITSNSGYSRPDPIEPADEKAALQKQFISSVTELRQLANRITAL